MNAVTKTISVYELQHSSIKQDGDNFWVVRDSETEAEFGDRVICEAFTRCEDQTHDEMLEAGYILYGQYNGEQFYIQDWTH